MSEKEPAALEIVKRNALYSAGVGIIAIPVVNVLGVTALQVKMLRELADHYAVPFKEDRVKSILSSLLSGLVGTELGYGLTGAATARNARSLRSPGFITTNTTKDTTTTTRSRLAPAPSCPL